MRHDQAMALPFEFTDDLVRGIATAVTMKVTQ
jgi:hypothetical protein